MKKAAKKATPSKKTAKPAKKVRSATVAADKLLGGKTQKVVRNSESGRFTDKAAAKRDPKGTETEKVTRKTKVATLKIPKSLPACVDLYDSLRAERLAIQKQAEEIGKKEAELREHLINNISKSDGSGVVGKLKKAVVVTKSVPTIEDEDKFLKFAHRKGNEDLVVEKPNMKAIEERWENNKAVPGVGKFNVVTLSLTKI